MEGVFPKAIWSLILPHAFDSLEGAVALQRTCRLFWHLSRRLAFWELFCVRQQRRMMAALSDSVRLGGSEDAHSKLKGMSDMERKKYGWGSGNQERSLPETQLESAVLERVFTIEGSLLETVRRMALEMDSTKTVVQCFSCLVVSGYKEPPAVTKYLVKKKRSYRGGALQLFVSKGFSLTRGFFADGKFDPKTSRAWTYRSFRHGNVVTYVSGAGVTRQKTDEGTWILSRLDGRRIIFSAKFRGKSRPENFFWNGVFDGIQYDNILPLYFISNQDSNHDISYEAAAWVLDGMGNCFSCVTGSETQVKSVRPGHFANASSVFYLEDGSQMSGPRMQVNDASKALPVWTRDCGQDLFDVIVELAGANRGQIEL